jgi:hypothetical protein
MSEPELRTVQTGDFRLNPEQPPLTKLWTGAYATLHGYTISPYRHFADKSDERDFVEEDAYVNNDPFALQSRARTSMFGLNALLIFCFALAARKVFGDMVAIAVTLFLAIDPTVAGTHASRDDGSPRRARHPALQCCSRRRRSKLGRRWIWCSPRWPLVSR